MRGSLLLLLHAHLPFVRHPEHDRFLEEYWLFEAVADCYLPLLGLLEDWRRDRVRVRLALTLSPTLCAMLKDRLLQERCWRYLNERIALAEQETFRTQFEPSLNRLASIYLERFRTLEAAYRSCEFDLVGAFAGFQQTGQLEIITTAATHAVLPLFEGHPPSIRAQIMTARDQYRACFGCDPRGIWLPECAYAPAVETYLREAHFHWFALEAHGVLLAEPRPRYALYAPIFTPNGLAAFGRDIDSAKQVWSRHEGYPGDPRYRDFYRDIAFDLDLDYLKPYLPAPPNRSFTGIKYWRITGADSPKQPYDPEAASQAAHEHARHFLEARLAQFKMLAGIMDQPPALLCPYDAELFGHWWHEGPQFLDSFVRKACQHPQTFLLSTPDQFLKSNPTHQIARPSPSSWGEDGYLKVWLNETNEWIFPHLQAAQERMSRLAGRFPQATELVHRALIQAGRELLLAQASDWPFILRTRTSPDYARRRVKTHLLRFLELAQQIESGRMDESWLEQVESQDNLFPQFEYRYWDDRECTRQCSRTMPFSGCET